MGVGDAARHHFGDFRPLLAGRFDLQAEGVEDVVDAVLVACQRVFQVDIANLFGTCFIKSPMCQRLEHGDALLMGTALVFDRADTHTRDERDNNDRNLGELIRRDDVEDRARAGRVDARVFQRGLLADVAVFERMVLEVAQVRPGRREQSVIHVGRSGRFGRGHLVVVAQLREDALLVQAVGLGRLGEDVVRQVLFTDVRRRKVVLLFLSALLAEIVTRFHANATANAEPFVAHGALPRRLFIDEFRSLTNLTDGARLAREGTTSRGDG